MTKGSTVISELAAKPSMPLKLAEIRAIDAEIDHASGMHPVSSLKPGTIAAGGSSIVGSEGYFFIADGTNSWEKQYLGQVASLDEWLASWRKVLEARLERAAALGIDLVHFIAPEKQVVLPHRRWTERVENGEKRPLRRLLSTLPAGTRLVYPEIEMRQASQSGSVFLRHDSHWSPSGCAIGVQSMLDELGVGHRLDTVDLQVRVEQASQDLTLHFFTSPPPEEILFFSPNGLLVYDNEHQKKTGRHGGSAYQLDNGKAPDPRKVLIFGDSYSYDGGITFLLSAVFQSVYFMWAKTIDWQLVEDYGADIVIWESAERFLTAIPAV